MRGHKFPLGLLQKRHHRCFPENQYQIRIFSIVVCKINFPVNILFQMGNTSALQDFCDFKHIPCLARERFPMQSSKSLCSSIWRVNLYNRCSEQSQNICIHSTGMKICSKYQNVSGFSKASCC